MIPSSRLFFIALVILVGTVLAGRSYLQARTDAYFAQALERARISMDISLGTERYRVSGGIVSKEDGSRLEGGKRSLALKRAYAVALARRHSVFGIHGTDPANLRAAVTRLVYAQTLLSEQQRSESDRIAVADHLYPTKFLTSLAELEEARRTFIVTGSDADENRYQEALGHASLIGSTSARSFAETFSVVLGTSTARAPTLGGTLTVQSISDSIEVLSRRFAEAEESRVQQLRCIAGSVRACDANDIMLTPPPPAEYFSTDPSPLSNTGTITEAKAEAHVAIATSTCLGTEPSPYVFTYGDFADIARLPVVYSGEIFFVPTKGATSDTLGYFRKALHIDYSFVNPLAFYMCPDVLTDLGLVNAIRATIHFAHNNPSLASTSRATLLSSPTTYEPRAIAYVRDVVSEITSRESSYSSLREFEEVLGTWRERSAGLDAVVLAVASVGVTDARAHARGIPFDISAKSLFLTHSAFPSLYLSHNTSAGSSTLPLKVSDPTAEAAFGSRLVRFSALVQHIPRNEIIRNLRAYILFENTTVE